MLGLIAQSDWNNGKHVSEKCPNETYGKNQTTKPRLLDLTDENDASAKPPNLISASCDLDL